jgi:hypothetical protein
MVHGHIIYYIPHQLQKTKSGNGGNTIMLKCTQSDTYSLAMQKQGEYGIFHAKVVKKGTVLQQASPNVPDGVVSLASQC